MYKQVIVIRTDLKMSKGKACVQVAHASVEAYKKANWFSKRKWATTGAKKAVLKVNTLKDLKKIYEEARKEKLPCVLISDAGKTEIPAGTITAVGIGPAESKKIDKITGKLKTL